MKQFFIKVKADFIRFRRILVSIIFIHTLFFVSSVFAIQQNATQQIPDYKGATYGPTTWKDTLLELAIKLRPNTSVTISQMMVALRDLNPDSFIDGNMNLLCRGHMLRVPSLDQIRKIPANRSYLDVQADNNKFKKLKKQGLIDESQCEYTEKVEAEPSIEGNSEPIEGTEEFSSDAEGFKPDEESDDASVERKEMPPPACQAAPVVLSEEKTPAAHDMDRKTSSEKDTPPFRVIVESKREKETDQVDTYIAIALNVLIIALILSAIFLYYWYMVRHKSLSVRYTEFDAGSESGHRPIIEQPATIKEKGIEKSKKKSGKKRVNLKDTEPLKQNYEIEKADIYIAYGKYQKAIDYLQEELKKTPDNLTLRLKLLDVYIETGDRSGFKEQALKIKATGNKAAISEVLKKKKKLS